jgi:hypothetical protein
VLYYCRIKVNSLPLNGFPHALAIKHHTLSPMVAKEVFLITSSSSSASASASSPTTIVGHLSSSSFCAQHFSFLRCTLQLPVRCDSTICFVTRGTKTCRSWIGCGAYGAGYGRHPSMRINCVFNLILWYKNELTKLQQGRFEDLYYTYQFA